MYLISKTEDLWAKRFLTLQVQSPSVLKIDGLWTLRTRAPHPPSSCIHLAEPRYADQASNTVTEDGLPFNTSLEIVIGPPSTKRTVANATCFRSRYICQQQSHIKTERSTCQTGLITSSTRFSLTGKSPDQLAMHPVTAAPTRGV